MVSDAAPRVLAIIGDDSGPTLWRIWQPFAELQKHGVFAHWKHVQDPELQDPTFQLQVVLKFDAILLARMSWAHRVAARIQLNAFHRAGMPVWLEIDDDMFSPGIVPRQYTVFERDRAKGLEQLERERQDRLWLLRQVDGVTVSTRRLQTIVRQHTEAPIEVVPNALDLRWFYATLRGVRRIVPPLTIGWAGGARNQADLFPVAAAWARIALRYPEVTFVVSGHMSDALVDSVPPERVRRLPWLPLAEYPRALLNIDIACASVAPALFNTAKTPIKLWEYTAAGAACVVSPTLYAPYVSDGSDALVAETAGEWEAALSRLIDSPDLRRTLRRAQRRRLACEHSLERTWQRWPIVWTRLLEDYRTSSATPTIVTAATA
jgi:glycosyltransferase involved in cell wall biosynthesis